MTKILRNACFFLGAILFLSALNAAPPKQSAQQTGDPAKSDSPATKNAAEAKKADSRGQNPTPVTVPSETSPNTADKTAPAVKPARTQAAPPAEATTTVWVNTDSGIYHKPGSRYYGKTKKGKYMTEADARRAGYRAAKKE